jgi:hypothetical protein
VKKSRGYDVAFGNAVVGGGGELVRDSIHSRNYVPGVSGWTIDRDGFAEFEGVTVRGDFFVGTPPSPPNPYIHGTVMSGVPTIAIYDGVHANPARIQGYDLGGDGGVVIDSGDTAGEDSSLALGGTFGQLFYEDVPNVVSALVHVGLPLNEAVKLRATGNGAQDIEIGLDLTDATPDGTGGVLYTLGEIQHNRPAPDSNYCSRIVDGKSPGVTTETTIGGTDTAVSTANIQNVYLEAGYFYRVFVHIDHRMSQLGTRLDYKLWNGAVGGNQLGGTNRRWAEFATATLFNGVVLMFAWRQTTTETVSNMNLSAVKGVNAAATAVVAVNQGYMATVEKSGDANMIGGL